MPQNKPPRSAFELKQHKKASESVSDLKIGMLSNCGLKRLNYVLLCC